MDRYIDFEESCLNRDKDIEKLVAESVTKLYVIYENHGIEHIFDRDSVLGLANKIQEKAINDFNLMC